MTETQFGLPAIRIRGINVFRLVRTLVGLAVIIVQLFVVDALDPIKIALGVLLFDPSLFKLWKTGR